MFALGRLSIDMKWKIFHLIKMNASNNNLASLDDIRAEVEDFAQRHNLVPKTVCNRALGYTGFLDKLEGKRKRESGMIKKLRKYMADFDAKKAHAPGR